LKREEGTLKNERSSITVAERESTVLVLGICLLRGVTKTHGKGRQIVG